MGRHWNRARRRGPALLGWVLAALFAGLSLAAAPVPATPGTLAQTAPPPGSPDAAAAQPPAATGGGSPAPSPADRRLRVGVVGSSPFVLAAREPFEGLSIDIWRGTASRIGVEFELLAEPAVKHGIDAVAAGELDVLVGPISVTSARAERVRFTQPYFQSSMGIASRVDSSPFWDRAGPFLSRAFFAGTLTLLLVLGLVGGLLWLLERRKNPAMFPHQPARGIGNGVWMALVTMTTVGYGDRVPVTLPGRIVTGIWMVIAMVSVSSLTAGIATALTLSQLDRGAIENANQLTNRRVAVVGQTTGAKFARAHDARVHAVGSLDEALSLLEAGRVDAVVHDRPILRYYLRQRGDEAPELRVSKNEYQPQGYGFAAPRDGALAARLSVGLLQMREAGELDELRDKWLGQ